MLSPLIVLNVDAQTASDLGLGVIRIMPDGRVEGTDKLQRNGDVYTLTDDINVELNNSFAHELRPCLLIMRSNIIVDGAGHTITSNGTGLGIYARGVQGVTIENFKLRGFVVGISSYIMDPIAPIEILYQSTQHNQILNNDIETVDAQSIISGLDGWGIFVEFSEDTLVSGNAIKTIDSAKGLYVGYTCNRTIITNNNFIGCGLDLNTLNEKVIAGNIIDGKPVIFLNGKSNEVVDDGEQVFIYNCSSITIRNIQPENDYRRTVQLEKTSESIVTNCQGIISLKNCNNNSVYANTARDISLFNSNYNRIYENTLSEGYIIYPRCLSEEVNGRCIDLSASRYNDIYNNTLKSCAEGIHLGEPEEASEYNKIYHNDIFNASEGVLLSYSPRNYVYSNSIHNCSVGLSVSVSDSIIATQNNITNCGLALSVMGSNNHFYHNNFIGNTNQAAVYNQMLFSSSIILAYSVNNTFDEGYPKGGNYWSNLQGVDSNGDGISEIPYIIDSNNTDNYPFMQPTSFSDFVPPDPPVSETPNSTPSSTQNTGTQQSTTNSPNQAAKGTATPSPTSPPIMPEMQLWVIITIMVLLSLVIVSVRWKKVV